MEVEEPPLRNLRLDLDEDGNETGDEDALLRLQRNDPGLRCLGIGDGTEDGDDEYEWPHWDDWGRTGRYIAKHDHLRKLSFGNLEGLPFDNFALMCREMSSGSSTISCLEFFDDDMFGGREFDALTHFLTKSPNLSQLIIGDGTYTDGYDARGLRMLSKALSKFHSLVDIQIPYIGIDEEVSEEIFGALGRHPWLRYLNLKGNLIHNRKSMNCLTRLLKKRNSLLESLNLDDIYGDDLGDEGVEILADGIAGSSLKRIDLNDNTMPENGWRAIFSTLHSPSCMLQELSLSSLNHDDVVFLVESLAINKSLRRLDLSCNSGHLQQQTWEIFFEYLRDSPLEELDLREEEFDDDHAISLGNALASNSNLRVLDLTGDNAITARGWRAISTALGSPRTALEKIRLPDAANNDDTAVSLGNALTANKKLKELSLCEESRVHAISFITATGLGALTKALCNSTDIMATFNSNHTLCLLNLIALVSDSRDELHVLLRMNREHGSRKAARLKIIKTHFGQDNVNMHPISQFESRVTPYLFSWMGRDDGRQESQKEGKELLYRCFRNVPGIFGLRQSRKRKARQTTLLD